MPAAEVAAAAAAADWDGVDWSEEVPESVEFGGIWRGDLVAAAARLCGEDLNALAAPDDDDVDELRHVVVGGASFFWWRRGCDEVQRVESPWCVR